MVLQIQKVRAPSKKGVDHPPLNDDVETVEKLTEDTGSGIGAVHPSERRIRIGREKERELEIEGAR